MFRKSLVLMAAACLAAAPCHGFASPPAGSPPKIQIAILLDTSNSMDGLIDQAKSQLWKIVNEFALCKRNGVRPVLEVALYEYGKQSLPAETGFIRQAVPLTTDLDRISEQLFALRTNGGNEYCGWVIDRAVRDLQWSTAPNDLKAIFIAGNEPFTQGKVDYRQACKAAIARGILVNTIHCGQLHEGEQSGWKDGALLADGSFTNIDQNKALVAIKAPQDREIARLGVELNKTYIVYGASGAMGALRQAAQDANAKQAAAADSLVQRSLFKSSDNYQCENWDLVDACRLGKVNLAEMKESDLPEALKKMTLEERKAYVEAKRKERTEIQKKIAALCAERDKFVEAERRKLAEKGDKTLDEAVIVSLRAQAEKKEFRFEKP